MPFTPARFAGAFGGSRFTVIGPAYVGYAASVPSSSHPVPLQWEHGGSLVGEQPSAGVFVGRELIGLAGYEVWGGTIAHIFVITHPAYRGRSFGRGTVAHVAHVALVAGLVPQYRTLQSNQSSIRIAEALGFSQYATSVAVKLNLAA